MRQIEQGIVRQPIECSSVEAIVAAHCTTIGPIRIDSENQGMLDFLVQNTTWCVCATSRQMSEIVFGVEVVAEFIGYS